ncbi:hypothetical protein ACSS6W_002253 [Trichoderma asperelloides]
MSRSRKHPITRYSLPRYPSRAGQESSLCIFAKLWHLDNGGQNEGRQEHDLSHLVNDKLNVAQLLFTKDST